MIPKEYIKRKMLKKRMKVKEEHEKAIAHAKKLVNEAQIIGGATYG